MEEEVHMICITVENSPNPLSVYIRLWKHQSATQPLWGGTLRDDTKNGCVADYGNTGKTFSIPFIK